MEDYDNHTIENFYWSPNSCDMLTKQCHVIFKFLNSNKNLQKLWIKNEFYNDAIQIRQDLLRSIIYTTWDNSFQVDKPILDWFSEYDQWFTRQFINTKAGRNWVAGINYLKENIDSTLLIDEGLKSYVSPDYYIDTFK